MLEERPFVMDAVRALATEHGYAPEDIRRSYAGWTARLVYEGVRGSRASIKVDINFLNRVPLYGVEYLPVPDVLDLDELVLSLVDGADRGLGVKGVDEGRHVGLHHLQHGLWGVGLAKDQWLGG